MRHKPYFKPQGGPGPLHMVCQRTIRLDEVDVLGIVWHGRYPSFLEDGREEMGRLFGLSYLDFKQAGVLLRRQKYVSASCPSPRDGSPSSMITVCFDWPDSIGICTR